MEGVETGGRGKRKGNEGRERPDILDLDSDIKVKRGKAPYHHVLGGENSGARTDKKYGWKEVLHRYESMCWNSGVVILMMVVLVSGDTGNSAGTG